MNPRYFDSHAHYDDARFDGDRDELLATLPEAGICGVVNPGSDLTSSRTALQLAEVYPYVWAAAGVHPHSASDGTEGIAELLDHPRCVAVGEIGLDYHYDTSPREAQRAVFREMMALAAECDLPVIIHDREAHADCMDIVRAFPTVRGVFHSYSGAWEQAAELVALGYCLSFTGIVTFPKTQRALEVAARLPADRILLETDAPYLAPVPVRGRRNDSRHLPHIAAVLAAARGVGVEELVTTARDNTCRLFGVEVGG